MHSSQERLQSELPFLYPELGGGAPDLDTYAESIIVRALNQGGSAIQEALWGYYGEARIRLVASERVNRLTNPAYRRWAESLHLPPRPAFVERIQALWRK
jgi:hypothetical protein